ncbi:DNA-binding SARP family transcriptional activator [Actinocrispum wychmicini]|uniref:DNA-binding SARP family transcriptional activator n=1 Tax=Actinocrispum wychmicini TaxID=1213861 RepID=A0A4R2JTK9_9PSEU|nr:DNA-binding SARP family transcriptional activator [Actinocrispum wychmicini]
MVNGDDVLSIGARKVETVLATLLVRANQVVTNDQLIGELWGERPPRRALAALHVYVSQLRKFLGVGRRGESPIVTRSPGYLIRVVGDDLDLDVFRRLVLMGREHMRAKRYEEASATFAEALDLWRGPALGDLREGSIVQGFATWLEELRLECVEMLVEADFMLGRHRELVSFLYTLVSEHPLHEAFYRQLMLALYRSDRQGDALQVYRVAREKLTAELGIEPCRALRDLHRAILQADDRLDDGGRARESLVFVDQLHPQPFAMLVNGDNESSQHWPPPLLSTPMVSVVMAYPYGRWVPFNSMRR